MAPPTATEQLIRDYLNRLSQAARDLAADDRRALLERIRSQIEQKAEIARRPSTMDVARVLARLPKPAALVEQERRRLAAEGKASPRATSAAPGRQRFRARALGREQGRSRGASFPWLGVRDNGGSDPPAPSNGVANGLHPPATATMSEARSEPAAQGDTIQAPQGQVAQSPQASAPANGPVQADRQLSPDKPAGAGSPVRVDGPVPAAGPAPADEAATPNPDSGGSGTTGAAPALTGAGPAPTGAGSPAPPRPAADGRRGSHHSGAADQPSGTGSPAVGTEETRRGLTPPEDPAAASGTERTDEEKATAADTSAASPRRTGSGRGGWRRPDLAAPDGLVRRQLARLLGWIRRRPLEAAAVVLMGIGGAIFPPIFLIGATLALASELWDGRDKWIGIALPVVLTVIGLAVGIAAGGRAHWQHESWVYLDVVSRVAAALGAGYLAWRTERPRRPPTVPPFSRPRRAS